MVPVEAGQILLQPRHGLGVQVVGGLVQEEHVGLLEKDPAEGHPPALSPGELGDIRIGGREPERIHGDLELAVEFPRTRGINALLQFRLPLDERIHFLVGREGRKGGVDLLVLAQEVARGLHAQLDVALDVEGRVELGLLRQIADPGTLGGPGLSLKVVVDPGHDAEERTLSGPVGTHDADLGARVEGKVDPLEDLPLGRDHLAEVLHDVDVLGSAHATNLVGWPRASTGGRLRGVGFCGRAGLFGPEHHHQHDGAQQEHAA
jgi:hypothetical protein